MANLLSSVTGDLFTTLLLEWLDLDSLSVLDSVIMDGGNGVAKPQQSSGQSVWTRCLSSARNLMECNNYLSNHYFIRWLVLRKMSITSIQFRDSDRKSVV